jgi:hypothetical protein
MAEAAFRPTGKSVTEFLTQLEDPQKRADSRVLVEIMTRVTGKKPKMWHPGIVGFGEFHYTYGSGREGDMPLAAFSPRKTEFSIYLDGRADTEPRAEILARLGKHRMGKGCLYVKRLDQVDLAVLEELIRDAMQSALAANPQK